MESQTYGGGPQNGQPQWSSGGGLGEEKRRATKDLWWWTERRIEDFGALVLARPPDPTRCRCLSESWRVPARV